MIKQECIRPWLAGLLDGGIDSRGARLFRPGIGLLIAINIGYVILYSFDAAPRLDRALLIASYFSAAVFGIEYLCRIWIAPLTYPSVRPWRARMKYLLSFFGIIDFIAILPFLLPEVLPINPEVVQMIDLARILTIFKIVRYSPAFALLSRVLSDARRELAVALSTAAVIVTVSAMMMYYIERNAQPEAFANVGAGFWWAVVTFATVGYGDLVPVTGLGRVLAGFIAVVGIGMIALPTAIISSALMNIMAERRTARTTQHNPATRHCPHCGKPLAPGHNGESGTTAAHLPKTEEEK